MHATVYRHTEMTANVAVLCSGDKPTRVGHDSPQTATLGQVLVAANAIRNLGFGLVVGGVIAAGVYYAFVISPEETVHSPAYYLGLAVVLGVSIALLLGMILSVVTLARLDDSGHS